MMPENFSLCHYCVYSYHTLFDIQSILHESTMIGSISNRDGYGIILTISNLVNHIFIILVTGYMLYLTGQYVSALNVHVGLCTVGYVLLMSEAFSVLSEENLWSRQVSRHGTNHLHWFLQFLGVSFNIAGIVVLYKTRTVHFKSIHGILGIASVGASCFIGLSGVPVFFAVKLSRYMRPVFSKFIHNFLGIVCFILGMLAQCYGYQKGWMIKTAGQEIATLCTVLTGIIALITIYRPIRSLFGQFKSILY